MIKIFMIAITLFAVIMVLYKRINQENIRGLRDVFIKINRYYIDVFRGKSSNLKLWQWIVFTLSQVFVLFAIIRRLFEEIYKYISDSYIIAFKIFTYLLIFLAIYFIVGYLLFSTRRIYKCLYKIEDKNTKTDLLISFFIISMYMTILILFPEQFREIYKIGLVGAGISYILNLKVLIKVIRSPQIIKIDLDLEEQLSNIGVMAFILLIMVLLSLYLEVCFVSSSGIGVYSNNPTYYDLFYYTIITFATVGYGDISPVSPVAKLMSMIISFTSVLCLTIFVSSVLSYKED